jgi:hypothetical protein
LYSWLMLMLADWSLPHLRQQYPHDCVATSDILDTCYKLNFQFQSKSGLPVIDLMIIVSKRSQILCKWSSEYDYLLQQRAGISLKLVMATHINALASWKKDWRSRNQKYIANVTELARSQKVLLKVVENAESHFA